MDKMNENLPIGTLRSDITIDGRFMKLTYEKDGLYYVGNALNYYYKGENLNLASIIFDALILVNGYETKDVIKHVKTEYKRLPELRSRLFKTLNWYSQASRDNAVLNGALNRLEGLRPVNNGKVTKWVKN